MAEETGGTIQQDEAASLQTVGGTADPLLNDGEGVDELGYVFDKKDYEDNEYDIEVGAGDLDVDGEDEAPPDAAPAAEAEPAGAQPEAKVIEMTPPASAPEAKPEDTAGATATAVKFGTLNEAPEEIEFVTEDGRRGKVTKRFLQAAAMNAPTLARVGQAFELAAREPQAALRMVAEIMGVPGAFAQPAGPKIPQTPEERTAARGAIMDELVSTYYNQFRDKEEEEYKSASDPRLTGAEKAMLASRAEEVLNQRIAQAQVQAAQAARAEQAQREAQFAQYRNERQRARTALIDMAKKENWAAAGVTDPAKIEEHAQIVADLTMARAEDEPLQPGVSVDDAVTAVFKKQAEAHLRRLMSAKATDVLTGKGGTKPGKAVMTGGGRGLPPRDLDVAPPFGSPQWDAWTRKNMELAKASARASV